MTKAQMPYQGLSVSFWQPPGWGIRVGPNYLNSCPTFVYGRYDVATVLTTAEIKD